MAIMKPNEVEMFQNSSEKESYELLKNLDETYMVIYEPSIGLQKRRTPDFIILSQKYGLIVLDVKYVKLDNIKSANLNSITKTSGIKMKNFYQIVKDYAYTVNNQLVKELKENTAIVHSSQSKMTGRLTFPHSSGLLLFIHDEEKYTKEDVATLLALNESDFLIVNKIEDNQKELENFIVNLSRPFVKSLTSSMQGEILKKIYIDSDASSNEFINTMSQFNLSLNKNFKDKLSGTPFEKSKQLKINLLEYTKFAQNSIDVANKNLGLGCENIIERLKGYKQELEEEKFTVAVFGYFSTGKSTFLNTLMGTDKLPMDEDRSTATFTRLRHCDESEDFDDGDMQVIYKSELDISLSYKKAIDKLNFEEDEEKKYKNFTQLESFKDELAKKLKEIKIKHYDSNQRDTIKNSKKTLNFIIDNNIPYGISDKVAKEDINKFLTDDKKAFGISEVIYYLDNPLLKDIEIVDTPGYGSENTMDTFKTQEFVKEANVLILLTEAKDPMSKEDEHKFLETYEDVYKTEDSTVNTDNLFVIANKVDESNKTTKKIKESIINKIDDNWEDSLLLKGEQIFTMSSKYHYDKIHTQDSKIVSENIDENDLVGFVDSYAIFLTKNRDKEIVGNSFKNIDNTIHSLNDNFNKIVTKMDRDIGEVQSNINKFKENREEISRKYNLYSQSISSIEYDLKKIVKFSLDGEKLNNEETAKQAYENYLKSIGLKSSKASKKHTKDFYIKIIKSIQKCTSEKNRKHFLKLLDKQIIDINIEIKKIAKELEEEYGITGLDTKIEINKNTIDKRLDDIEFDKGFFNIVGDIVSIGFGVNAGTYAKKIVARWSDETYAEILSNIENSNRLSINKIQRSFKKQSDEIIDSIGKKLEAIEKNIKEKQKDKVEYNQKIEKMKLTFEKISKLKETVEQQKNDLYS